jgi:hypothetical protein
MKWKIVAGVIVISGAILAVCFYSVPDDAFTDEELARSET